MAVEIRWTPQSVEDIQSIAEFIGRDSIYYAQVQTQLFLQRTKVLQTSPKYGKVVPEMGRDDLRELIEGNYRIIYRLINEKRIDILTVHHVRRLLSNNPAFE